MYWAGRETVRKFDQFKQQIFNKKKDQFKHKQSIKKKAASKLSQGARPTNHPFFRKLIYISVVSVGFYIANEKFKLVHQLLTYLDTIQLNPVHRATINTLASDLSRRFSLDSQHHTLSQSKNAHFANICFSSEIQLHLRNLNQKNVPRTIVEESNSYFAFGPFKFDNRKQRMFVSKQGTVVNQIKKSKFKIGQINLFGSKVQQIIEHKATVNLFMKHKIQDVVESCKIINFINGMTLSKEYYDKIYSQCVTRNNKSLSKIQEKLKNISQNVQKNKGQRRFFINIS